MVKAGLLHEERACTALHLFSDNAMQAKSPPGRAHSQQVVVQQIPLRVHFGQREVKGWVNVRIRSRKWGERTVDRERVSSKLLLDLECAVDGEEIRREWAIDATQLK